VGFHIICVVAQGFVEGCDRLDISLVGFSVAGGLASRSPYDRSDVPL
jgi:hypothetical protein